MRRIVALVALVALSSLTAPPAAANTDRRAPYDGDFGYGDWESGLVGATRVAPGASTGAGGVSIVHRAGRGWVRVRADFEPHLRAALLDPNARLCIRVRTSTARCVTLTGGSEGGEGMWVQRDYFLPETRNWTFDAYVTTTSGNAGWAGALARVERIRVTNL